MKAYWMNITNKMTFFSTSRTCLSWIYTHYLEVKCINNSDRISIVNLQVIQVVLDGVSNILRMTTPGPERDTVATLIEECGGIDLFFRVLVIQFTS